MKLKRKLFIKMAICLAAGFWISSISGCTRVIAQNVTSQGNYRPSLFFREDWKEIPAATPVTQQHVFNSDLLLNLYGPGCDSIKKSHHETPIDDPYYIWSGLCLGNWAVTLKHKTSFVDLSSIQNSLADKTNRDQGVAHSYLKKNLLMEHGL